MSKLCLFVKNWGPKRLKYGVGFMKYGFFLLGGMIPFFALSDVNTERSLSPEGQGDGARLESEIMMGKEGKKLSLWRPMMESEIMMGEEEKKGRDKKVWFQVVLFNDNFGSQGNERGLTHGSRFTLSKRPSEEAEWNVSLESQLYLDWASITESGEKARVFVVERDTISLEKRRLFPGNKYILFEGRAGYTTSDPNRFLFIGAQRQQELFHDLLHSSSDDIFDYEYANDECLEQLEFVYRKQERLRLQIQESERQCLETAGDIQLEEEMNCSNFQGILNSRLENLSARYHNKLKDICALKTKHHVGGQLGLGKIFPFSKQSLSYPASSGYFETGGGLDFTTIPDRSLGYFFAKVNLPLFRVPFESEPVFGAFAELKFKKPLRGGTEKNQVLGVWLSSERFNINLQIMKPTNSSERLLHVPNDDDSIVYLLLEWGLFL